MKIYLQSTKGNPDTKFEVLSYDPETKKGMIMGSLGKSFPADMSKEALAKSGYRVIKLNSAEVAKTEAENVEE